MLPPELHAQDLSQATSKQGTGRGKGRGREKCKGKSSHVTLGEVVNHEEPPLNDKRGSAMSVN